MSAHKVDFPLILNMKEQGNSFIELLKESKYSSIVVLSDSNTYKYCYPLVKEILDTHSIAHSIIEISAGEEHKGMHSAMQIWKELMDLQCDRNALLVNLGGGMILDIGAFAASLYKRGIDFVHMPTSLLAMVDASIGGKNGIDLYAYKNQIGTFKQAEALFFNSDFLTTLSEKEMLSGMAEVYKHALILDSVFWKELLELDLNSITKSVIIRAAQLKESIVKEDPFEKGIRKILNFGHSIGHGIESFFLNKGEAIPHGYAVVAGMLCEAYISKKQIGLSHEEFKQIKDLLTSVYPKLNWVEEEQEHILNYIKNDKKNKVSKMLFVLIEQIGSATYDQEVSNEVVIDSLNYYRNEL